MEASTGAAVFFSTVQAKDGQAGKAGGRAVGWERGQWHWGDHRKIWARTHTHWTGQQGECTPWPPQDGSGDPLNFRAPVRHCVWLPRAPCLRQARTGAGQLAEGARFGRPAKLWLPGLVIFLGETPSHSFRGKAHWLVSEGWTRSNLTRTVSVSRHQQSPDCVSH